LDLATGIIADPAAGGKGDGGGTLRDFARRWTTPVKPSTCRRVRHVSEAPEGRPLYFIMRESNEERRGNLVDQEADMRRQAGEMGREVVGAYGDVWHSRCLWRILPHLEEARRLGAVPVFETMDRMMRPEGFDARTRELFFAPYLESDIEYLEQWLGDYGDYVVYFLAHPDAAQGEWHGEHTRRGMTGKGHMGGRGNKVTTLMRQREKRERLEPEVLRLHGKGYGYARIAAEVGMSKSWVQQVVGRSKTGAVSGVERVTDADSAYTPPNAPTSHRPNKPFEREKPRKTPRKAPAGASGDPPGIGVYAPSPGSDRFGAPKPSPSAPPRGPSSPVSARTRKALAAGLLPFVLFRGPCRIVEELTGARFSVEATMPDDDGKTWGGTIHEDDITTWVRVTNSSTPAERRTPP
jgi:hypothetical protein